jgi:hypothetical protein
VNRIVLAEGTTRDAIDDAAYAGGWMLLNILPAGEQHPAQRIFLAPDRQCFLHFVEDARLGPPYAVVQGADAARWEDDVRARLVVGASLLAGNEAP